MRALDSEVADAVWLSSRTYRCLSMITPKGGHRHRIPDRFNLEDTHRLVTGCPWVTAEKLTGYEVSDATLRSCRDEWTAAGVFDALESEAVQTYDRIVGLDLTETAVDGSMHKAHAAAKVPAKPC